MHTTYICQHIAVDQYLAITTHTTVSWNIMTTGITIRGLHGPTFFSLARPNLVRARHGPARRHFRKIKPSLDQPMYSWARPCSAG